ncbi:integral membrane protein [Nitritalea halalkaliphila LW7]|uniref:Integral membrane protein n=1 Tax=Nitritalea halalkaliphila LW7 TaxID=1189621 RepID=I5BT69_9BACT|nr:YdcF family protein [Nitritalea halalkaliphila]EIM72771.1 integral membrane protein [Nitritalea halalkaliphila LW7]
MYLLLLPGPVQWVIERQEDAFPGMELQPVPAKVEGIMVLGSEGIPDSRTDILGQIGRAGVLPRLLWGRDLALAYPNLPLVLSSAGRPGGPSQASLYREFLLRVGWQEPERLVLLETPRTTREEAQTLRAAFPEWRAVVIVSHANHLPRVKRIFEKEGFEVHAVPATYTVLRHPAGEKLDWMPDLRHLHLWAGVVKEWIEGVMVNY